MKKQLSPSEKAYLQNLIDIGFATNTGKDWDYNIIILELHPKIVTKLKEEIHWDYGSRVLMGGIKEPFDCDEVLANWCSSLLNRKNQLLNILSNLRIEYDKNQLEKNIKTPQHKTIKTKKL